MAPVLPNASKDTLERTIETVNQQNEEAFSRFLLNQGLAPLWAKQLEKYAPLSDTFKKTLKVPGFIPSANTCYSGADWNRHGIFWMEPAFNLLYSKALTIKFDLIQLPVAK